MTAIAYRDGIMAADTLTCGADMRRGHAPKIARSPEGTIGAASGEAAQAERFRRWVAGGEIDDWLAHWADAGTVAVPRFCDGDGRLPVASERGSFGAIIATKEGRVVCVDWRGYPVEVKAPFYVEGGAEPILMGALAAGASAAQAVKIAIEYDVGCGGSVQVESISGGPAAGSQ